MKNLDDDSSEKGREKRGQLKDTCCTEEQWDFLTKNGFGDGGRGTNQR